MNKEQIEQEVQAAFPIKSRVRLSAKGKMYALAKNHDRQGEVCGYVRGGFAHYGFDCMCCLRVHWDGCSDKTSHSAYYDRFELVS